MPDGVVVTKSIGNNGITVGGIDYVPLDVAWARIAKLEAALERLWPWALAYGETTDMTTAEQVASYQEDIDACRAVLLRKST